MSDSSYEEEDDRRGFKVEIKSSHKISKAALGKIFFVLNFCSCFSEKYCRWKIIRFDYEKRFHCSTLP